jgi:hypothetical protein
MQIDSLKALRRDIEQLGASIARLAHALGLSPERPDDLSRAFAANMGPSGQAKSSRRLT